MSSPSTPRTLKWAWTQFGFNIATASPIALGGGVLFGLIVNNFTGTAFNINICAFSLTTDTPTAANIVFSLPLPASGSLIILPEEFGICEVTGGKHMFLSVSTGAALPGTIASAGQVSLQCAIA